MRATRRQWLQWIGGAIATSALPIGCGSSNTTPNPAPVPGAFFTDDERVSLAALADGILPPDDQPGGAALGTVPYVERMLGIFERGDDPPKIFCSGPYSGRQPFANDDGSVGTNHPPDDFANGLPIDRVTERAWRLFLYGSDGVAGGGPNDAVTGPIIGLRDQLRDLLKRARDAAKKPLNQSSATEIAELIANLTIDDRTLLIDLVAQAAFGNPEYGGNPNGAGWKMVHFEGDNQPLGYTQFDATSGTYKERPDAPMSGPSNGDPEPMDDDARAFVKSIVVAIDGKEFT